MRLDATTGELLHATFLGGSNNEEVMGMVFDPQGNVVLAGGTSSADFPTTPGALLATRGDTDSFVSCLDVSGSRLLFSATIGGAGPASINAITRLPSGELVVGGLAGLDFPTTPGAFDETPPGSFVMKLDERATTILASTIVGDTGQNVLALDVGPDGRIYAAGSSTSDGFPTTPTSFAPVGPAGTRDGCVACFSPDLTELVWGSYLGGTVNSIPEFIWCLAVDPYGNVVVGGQTAATDFPITPDVVGSSYSGVGDGFVTVFAPNGETLIASSYLGGDSGDRVMSVSLDVAGVITLAGRTWSATFPTTEGALQPVWPGPRNGFVTRLSPDLEETWYSTYLGGSGWENEITNSSTGLDQNDLGDIFVTGTTDSSDFPVTPGAIQPRLNGDVADLFITRFDALPTGIRRRGNASPACGAPTPVSVTAMAEVGSSEFAVLASVSPRGPQSGALLVSSAILDAPLMLGSVSLWIDPTRLIAVIPVQADDTGIVRVRMPVPDTAAIAGSGGACQFIWTDVCPTVNLAASQALEIIVQP